VPEPSRVNGYDPVVFNRLWSKLSFITCSLHKYSKHKTCFSLCAQGGVLTNSRVERDVFKQIHPNAVVCVCISSWSSEKGPPEISAGKESWL